MQERTEFVSREGILADIQEDIDFKSLTLTEDANNRMNDGLRLAQRRIRKYPAADVRPVVVAHWEWDENGMDWNLGAWKCSNCRRKAETWWANDKHNPLRCAGSRFCGNCGAEMRNTAALKNASQYADAGAMAPAT